MARPKTAEPDRKTFHMLMPKDLWMYLKEEAMNRECSMSDIVLNALMKGAKKKLKAKELLTEE